MPLKMMIAGFASLTLATAAPAATRCWGADAVAAARISEFNAAMMVTTLRCALINIDIKPSYETFTGNYRVRLQNADDRLKHHFAEQGTTGEADYHQFYTQVGNRYGAAMTDSARCALFAAVATDLARSGTSEEALDKYAAALVPDPRIMGDRCAELAAKP